MWKTRFEVNTNHNNNLIRHRNLPSSSKIIHHHYSRSSPKVPRVRDDSPNAIVRPSPPSSMSNLEILTEEDEDIPCSSLTNNEQPNLRSIILRKQNSYQIVLPTIIESNDHEIMIDNEQNTSQESIDDKHKKYIVKFKRQDSFVATNTNYNQIMNVDIEKKERILNTNKNNEMIEFTLDKRINELLQQKNQRKNKVRGIMLVFARSSYQ
jgi:hypothetical protein